MLIPKKKRKIKKIYKKLSNTGSFYKWYASKQFALILDEQKKEKEVIYFFAQCL